MAKYTYRRTKTDGTVYWAVNPPGKWKEYVEEAKYSTFSTRSEALSFANKLQIAYSDAVARQVKVVYVPEDSVDGLMSFYRTTNEYRRLKHNSKQAYALLIKDASRYIGEQKAESIGVTQADRLFQTIQKDISNHRAVHVVKLLRRVWNTCMRHGKVKRNPFQKMSIKALPDRKVLWEPAQVDTFIEKADELGLHSIGTIALLCYHLCQRPGDMRKLSAEHVKDGVASIQQEKTGIEVEIPLSNAVIERLNTYGYPVNPNTGKPHDRWAVNKLTRRVRIAANLPDELQIRDLRRTGATEMAEAGCTEDELRAVTGHQTRDVLSIYVRPTAKLAAAGVSKRFG